LSTTPHIVPQIDFKLVKKDNGSRRSGLVRLFKGEKQANLLPIAVQLCRIDAMRKPKDTLDWSESETLNNLVTLAPPDDCLPQSFFTLPPHRSFESRL
jgi:hypothetical protein